MQEKHAVLVLLGLAVAGHAAHRVLQRPSEPPGQVLAERPDAGDPIAHRDRAIRLSRPLQAGETVDVNLAPAEEIARLPQVGMSLAKRIVAYRNAHGPFGSLSDLDAVPGVGPATLGRLEGKLTFGGIVPIGEVPGREDLSRRGTARYGAEPAPVNLNTATEAELRALPGIGPVRARAILAYRREKGPFAKVSDLRAVPGFSQGLVRRLGPLVTVR
ncbi:MAG: ComEA family DNA-binding protein [Gemmatimonadales bacterium]